MSESFAIIPVREFNAAKLRLRPVLSEENRRLLSKALLTHVLGAIELSEIQRIVVVASDTDEISRDFAKCSKLTLIKENVYHGGVNSAVSDALKFLNLKSQSKGLVFPSDLPMLNHHRINDVLGLLDKYELVVNPSYKKNGTNLLGSTSLDRFAFHYDDDSYKKHVQEAELRRLRFLTLDWDEFSFDIDDADDLEMLIDIYKTTNFDEVFQKISQVVD